MTPSPFNPRTTREAAHWLTETMEGALSPEQRQALDHWRAAHPDNERAWLHIEALRRRMAGLEPQAGYQSLSQSGLGHSRRQALKTLAVLGLFGCAGQLAYRNFWQSNPGLTYSNGASAPQHINLEDGSRLTLDADSEITVHFDSQQRLVQLRNGRLLLSSGHPADAGRRPLRVATAQGLVRAVGTRFSVELQGQVTQVELFEGAVEVQPQQAPSSTLRLAAGQRVRFTATHIEPATGNQAEPAWSRGLLVADNMRLDAFVAQLSRYRPGLLRCSDEIAALRVSGVYPLKDTDAVLDALPHSLPLQVQRRSRYWVTLDAR
ncbi:FecR domain-containing protein [Pseudomonas rubra]|uniref:FecR domain-containing protein n=1 Tax=Pseudomonas rubra TaxID=2942627 RepID=A0ABT5P5T3_9PSED|nr:FecR domain-containing protein [Pseudomonas rubra]MDD1013428.1 FecR domain-containing protein [Pseudomonas rubra]MDD1040453.1 FecR domain-containing protein [Pseudomonas rubra]MDD1155058.1 FecR domain-containing protein [Pseudomonas rubra]